MFSYTKDGKNYWTVVIESKIYQFNPTHEHYNELVECVKSGDSQRLIALLDKAKTINEWSDGDFFVAGGVLMYKPKDQNIPEEVNRVIAARIMEMIREGFDHKPMLRFLERLYKNPSYRAINELYNFLEHKHLPITPDGYFLAYKAVTHDFKDKRTKTFDNSVGATPEVHRRQVDDNCNVGCSYGLHVGTIEYVKSFGSGDDKTIICKVDPGDVVSVPLDCNEQKVRCCKYEVVGIFEVEFNSAVVDTYYDEEYDDYEDDDDDCDGFCCGYCEDDDECYGEEEFNNP